MPTAHLARAGIRSAHCDGSLALMRTRSADCGSHSSHREIWLANADCRLAYTTIWLADADCGLSNTNRGLAYSAALLSDSNGGAPKSGNRLLKEWIILAREPVMALSKTMAVQRKSGWISVPISPIRRVIQGIIVCLHVVGLRVGQGFSCHLRLSDRLSLFRRGVGNPLAILKCLPGPIPPKNARLTCDGIGTRLFRTACESCRDKGQKDESALGHNPIRVTPPVCAAKVM